MTTAVADLITAVSDVLLDPDNDRWDDDFHLESVNQAQRLIVILKPDALIVTSTFQLVAGTRQSLPSGATGLNRVIKNMGTGSTPGDIITMVSKSAMDAFLPGWHSVTADATVEHYMYDERNPTVFDVYPPQPVADQGYVEASYQATPTVLTTPASDNIQLADIYQDPIQNLMIARAYSLDAANSANAAQRALTAYNQAMMTIDRKDLVERIYSAKVEKNVNNNSNVRQ
jgi:hypothetical protein